MLVFFQEYCRILWNSCRIFHGILAKLHHILEKNHFLNGCQGAQMSLYFFTSNTVNR